jgi:hypothetical protein
MPFAIFQHTQDARGDLVGDLGSATCIALALRTVLAWDKKPMGIYTYQLFPALSYTSVYTSVKLNYVLRNHGIFAFG